MQFTLFNKNFAFARPPSQIPLTLPSSPAFSISARIYKNWIAESLSQNEWIRTVLYIGKKNKSRLGSDFLGLASNCFERVVIPSTRIPHDESCCKGKVNFSIQQTFGPGRILWRPPRPHNVPYRAYEAENAGQVPHLKSDRARISIINLTTILYSPSIILIFASAVWRVVRIGP